MAEPVSLPADPWEGIDTEILRQRPGRRPGRTLFLIVVTVFLAIYTSGVVYVVVAAEW